MSNFTSLHLTASLDVLTNHLPASKHYPHPLLLHRTNRRADLVPRELLPDGPDGIAVGGEFWD
jgi:hypothetical protein